MTTSERNKPIGIFDSGIGGLTVANAILKALPNERIVYFGDTAHLPYGEKSSDAIRYFALKISKFLLEQDCKMIVIACNSVSSTAYNVMLEFFQDRALFVNVVDPLVEKVIEKNYKKVGVIATKATTRSSAYPNKLKSLDQGIEVSAMATPLLVPMIEEGFYNNQISRSIIENYLTDQHFESIEALLLACTHYPLIKNDIQEVLGPDVEILDSALPVAEKVKLLLESKNLNSLNKDGEDHFYVSDYTSSFEETTQIFFEGDVKLEEVSIW